VTIFIIASKRYKRLTAFDSKLEPHGSSIGYLAEYPGASINSAIVPCLAHLQKITRLLVISWSGKPPRNFSSEKEKKREFRSKEKN
jgi:hypothetical protein